MATCQSKGACAAGLDLATADEAAVVVFVRRFREGQPTAPEPAAG